MRPQFRCRLRTWIVAIAGFALSTAYVGSYYRSSRRGMEEATAYGLDGFLYVPIKEAAAVQDLSSHYRLAAFYSPVNWIDRQFFGGEAPVQCIMWKISG